jgi:hypothetical protein
MLSRIASKRKVTKPVTTMKGQSTATLLIDLPFEALRTPGDRLNALAIELLGRIGGYPLDRLVLEATHPKTRPGHRVRLLRAIQRLGVVPDTASYITLVSLVADKSPEVRAAAVELIDTLRERQGEVAGSF